MARLLLGGSKADDDRPDVIDRLIGEFRRAGARGLLQQNEALADRRVHAAMLARPVRRDPAARVNLAMPPKRVVMRRPQRQIAQPRRQGGRVKGAHLRAKGGVLGRVRAQQAEQVQRLVARGRLAEARAMGLDASIDARQRQRALEKQADVEFVREADGAMHLDRPFGHRERGVARPRAGAGDEFKHARPRRVGDARRFEHIGARQFDVAGHVDGAMLQGLKGAQRAAELPARAHVVERAVENLARHADQFRREPELQRNPQTIERRGRPFAHGDDMAAVEPDIREVDPRQPRAVGRRVDRDGDALGAARHIDQREPLRPTRVDDETLGDIAVRHEMLGAIEPPAAALGRGERRPMAGGWARALALQGRNHQRLAIHRARQNVGPQGGVLAKHAERRGERREARQQLAAKFLADDAEIGDGQRRSAIRLGRQQARPGGLRERRPPARRIWRRAAQQAKPEGLRREFRRAVGDQVGVCVFPGHRLSRLLGDCPS